VTGLPVLESFQRFLDAERRRTRNRMMALTALFVVLLIVVGGVSALVGTSMFRKAHNEIEDVQEDVLAIKGETRGIRTETKSMIQNAAVSLAKKQSALAKQSQARLRKYDVELGRMESQVSALKARNSVLGDELNTVREILPSLSTDLRLVVNLMEDMRPMEPELVEPLLSTPETISMRITPAGIDQEIPWRLPIPE
jgi:uncharacterized membrane protein YgaE (UPF0421/DUF939 family)